MKSFLIILAALVGSTALLAQDSRATITGSVTDSQGSMLPAARVEAKNLNTNVIYPAITTTAGIYTIPLVPTGTYSITASHQGFERSIQAKVDVRAGERVQADFKLSAGAITREVVTSGMSGTTLTSAQFGTQVLTQRSDFPHD